MNLPPISPASAEREIPELRTVSRQFEALFANQMISAMRKTIVKDGLIPEGQGEKVYQSMLDSEHARHLSETDQLGLSQIIYEQLLRGVK